MGQGLLIVEASRSHSDTPHSVRRLWTSDQPDAETSIWRHNTRKRETSMPSAGCEPAIPASQRPQTHTLDRAATGIGFSGLLWSSHYQVISLTCIQLFWIAQFADTYCNKLMWQALVATYRRPYKSVYFIQSHKWLLTKHLRTMETPGFKIPCFLWCNLINGIVKQFY